MKKLLIATGNPGKFAEIKRFLSDLPLEFVSLSDLNINQGVEETGKTYKENSEIKAIFFSKLSNLPTIADDGGLEIEELGGKPGVNSRRWLGRKATDEELVVHLKKISKKLKNRKAFFKTVVSFTLPGGKVFNEEGVVEGEISKEPKMRLLKGYPFRSFFYLPKIKKYYHEDELTKDEERMYNHRYKAIQKINSIIKRELKL